MRLIKHPYARWIIYPIVLIIAYPLLARAIWTSSDFNGFSVDDPLIPVEEIHHGGPPRDGIPSLDKPDFILSKNNTRVNDDDKVLGLTYRGLSKAYPIQILDHHEIVNDSYAGSPILISYCPLCGTGMAFKAEVDGRKLSFGVSGLLYNSDVLMYDRQTNSLWSQIRTQAISGKMKGKKLDMLPLEHTTWKQWKSRHPDTLLLSFDTGFSRNYRETLYVGYSNTDDIYFPVSHEDKRYHPKEIVIGLAINGVFKAYPMTELSKSSSPLLDNVNGQPVKIYFDSASRSGRIEDEKGMAIPSLTAFWFAWFTFHPETAVFTTK